MGKFLMYLYLVVACYCVANVFLSIQAEAYQLTILMVFLTFINLILFSIFRKDVKRRQFGGLSEAE
jgi:nicotinamide riboside transporter PnuC